MIRNNYDAYQSVITVLVENRYEKFLYFQVKVGIQCVNEQEEFNSVKRSVIVKYLSHNNKITLGLYERKNNK